jgi:hypothetical protein
MGCSHYWTLIDWRETASGDKIKFLWYCNGCRLVEITEDSDVEAWWSNDND